MISPHLYKIKRTSNYDFLNRASFYRLDWNERNYPFSKQIIKNLKKTITNYSLQAYPADQKKLIFKIAKFEKINSNYIEIANDHINKILENSLLWRNSKELLKARDECSEILSMETNNDLNFWSETIKKI